MNLEIIKLLKEISSLRKEINQLVRIKGVTSDEYNKLKEEFDMKMKEYSSWRKKE